MWSKSLKQLVTVCKLRKFTLTPVNVDIFRCLDQLLAEVWDGLDGRRDWPPPKQEQECIAVACLNLLKLQFHSILQRKIRLNCLQPGTTLLASLKNKVVELASNANVLETIQKSAQGCLQVSWMILLPTPDERARALSGLLPNSNDPNAGSGCIPTGKRFMTDLLVSSLMADGGLETALMAAIKVEVQDLENNFFEKELKDKDVTNEAIDQELLMTEQAQLESESKRYLNQGLNQHKVSNIPLMLLVKQLLKNCGFHVTASLRNGLFEQNNSNLNLLLRFQRLLFVQLFNDVDHFYANHPASEQDYHQGKLSLMKKYMNLLSSHVTEILPLATSLAQEGPSQYIQVCQILQKDVIGLLLPEFIMSLTLLHLEDNHKLLNSSVSSLQSWLQILDQFNGLAQGSAKEDQDDLSWPGMAKYQTSKKHDSGEAFEVPMIRKGKVFSN